MAQGVTGYFDLTGGQGITARIYYSETYAVETNTSTVSITALQIKCSDWYGVIYYLDGTISVEGSAVVSMSSGKGTHPANIQSKNTFYNVTGNPAPPWASGTIAHNTDGSKSIAISVDFRGYTRSGGAGSGWRVQGSKTIALTTIPRASTIGATDANIGAVSMIAVSRKSSAYTHSIQYVFGDLSGYITESGGVSVSEVKFVGTSIPFLVPTLFYAQIPNAKSGVCTLTCRTYSGNTQIGDTQTATFVATASEAACKPSVSGTVVDTNDATKALTGDANRLVRYMSTALCTISATPKNSASIIAKSIAGTTVSGDTRTIAAVETDSFVFAATDSRGYSNSAAETKALVPYVKLTSNPSATRNGSVSGDAQLYLSGDYYNGSFGAADNTMTAKYRIAGGDWVEVTPAITGNTYALQVGLSGLDYQTAYNIEVSVADKLATINKSIILEAADPGFYWGKDYFNFRVPITITPAIYSQNETTEDGLNIWLNARLTVMPIRAVETITFCSWPAVAGETIMGLLYKYSDDFAAVFGWDYAGKIWLKRKINGSWQVSKSLSLY